MTERKIALYPIAGITGEWLDEPFDESKLPATILPNATIEDARQLFSTKAFDLFQGYLSKREMDSLKRVRYAIVYRYSENYREIGESPDVKAEKIIRYLAVCLRLVRPMQQDASFIRGRLLRDSTLEIQHFENPYEMDVPAIQKLFRLRNRDVARLQKVAPQFMTAMAGEFWKFRIAVELHESVIFRTHIGKVGSAFGALPLKLYSLPTHPNTRGRL